MGSIKKKAKKSILFSNICNVETHQALYLHLYKGTVEIAKVCSGLRHKILKVPPAGSYSFHDESL